MKLEGKKALIARTLGIGKGRIVFNLSRLSEIKEAITKQDVKDLINSGAIIIKSVKGTHSKKERKTRRRIGSMKIKVNKSKQEYMLITRKLRAYLRSLKASKLISQAHFIELRKRIRTRSITSLNHLKERIAVLKMENKK